MTTTVIAFDRKSARTFDADGRMRVRDCILSTAEVNPYRGAEIPKRDAFGLDANEVYDLYRDPAELGHPDSLASFEGVPLMIRHIVQTADEPRKDYVGGSVHNVHFDGKHLRGDLLVWDGHAIDLIESGELADLSCGYRYVPVMQSGEADGQHFHGRMTAIRGNHVALVDTGRATNAHVADSAFVDPRSSNPTMNGEANMAFPEKGAPQGAQPGGAPQAAPAAPAAGAAPGAAPADAGGGMAEVGAAIKALSEQMAQLMQCVQGMAQPQAAAAPAGMDMELEEKPAAQIEGAEDNEHEERGEREGAMDDEDESEEESEAEREGRGAMDAEEEEHDPNEPNGTTEQPRPKSVSEGRSAEQPGRKSLSGGNNNPSLGAMDAAIQKAVTQERARAKAAERARREVAHVLGGDIALDSAGDIYREALVVMGVPSASIKRGTEHAAWIAAQAAQAAAAGYNAAAHADMALDSDTTKAVRSDMAAKLAKIKVRA
jgi:uncharacterized protein